MQASLLTCHIKASALFQLFQNLWLTVKSEGVHGQLNSSSLYACKRRGIGEDAGGGFYMGFFLVDAWFFS